MEGILEQVLEKLISTDVDVHELKHDLLSLTQMVECHTILIKNKEWRLNQLASQVKTKTNENVNNEIINGDHGRIRER